MVEMLSYYQAVREALHDEMKNDDTVVLFGEDVRYNLYAYTYGLLEEFGEERIYDTPLSEAAVVGTAIGAAMCGMRPVVDLTVSNFLYVAMDQIISMAAKTIYQYNGNYKIPLTIMASSAYGNSAGAQHSDRLHAMLMGVPGIKIVVPSNPQDMYSLLRTSIRDDNPVICFQDKNSFYSEGPVNRDLIIPLGKANMTRCGSDITLVGIHNCANLAKKVADRMLDKENIHCDVIDVRTVNPLDYDCIFQSVKKTGRIVIVDSANRTCSTAAQISSVLSDKLFLFLKEPIKIVATEDVPLPYSSTMEMALIPNENKIEDAIYALLKH